MIEAISHTIMLTAMFAFVVSTLYRIYIMQRNTREWNGLGRAMRYENLVFLTIGLWVLIRSLIPSLNNDIVRSVIFIAMTLTTLRVAYLLPRVPLRISETRDARDIRQDMTAHNQAITGELQAETGRELNRRALIFTQRGIDVDIRAAGQDAHESDLVKREADMLKAVSQIEGVVLNDIPEIKYDVKKVRKKIIDEGV